MDRGLRSALRHQSDNTHEAGKPRQATLWYDAGTGRVYGVGDGRPDGCIRSVKTVTVKYDGGGALPELANPESVRMTKAL
ncbi:MAG: hypothetical protein KKE05_06165, partial [Nanoarchaeota archaeon]|nr:hypothetical protein [Nanoarchaeota archaeon]